MIHVSGEFRAALAAGAAYRCRAEIALADGTELTFTDEQLALGGNSVTDGAGSESLPLGAAVARTARLSLMNDGGQLDGYDFFGAVIRLFLDMPLDGRTETVDMGTFTVLEPESWGTVVELTGCDDMYKADTPYKSGLSFPATLGTMFREICERCAIPFSTAAFPNEGYEVPAAPAGELTCRQVLGCIALLAGGSARVSRDGRMEILPWPPAGEEQDHDLSDWIDMTMGTDDVLVTGLATEREGPDGERQTFLAGEEGYVLQVEDPLIPAGREQASLEAAGAGLLGRALRPFQGTFPAWPMAEFMDTVSLGDGQISVVTDVTFTFGGVTEIQCAAESGLRNSSRYVTAETKARLAARELVRAERTARETAVQALEKRLADSGGLYSSTETLPDESVVYYLHDRPTLEASGAVMKLTAGAIGFSADGGQSWPFGISVTGETILGILQAEGLDAEWVRFGTLDQERVEGLAELGSSLELVRERLESRVWMEDVDAAAGTAVEQASQLIQDRVGVVLSALEEYVQSSQLEEFRQALSARLAVLADQVTVEISRTADQLRQADSELLARYEQFTKSYRFTEDGLLIGDSQSGLTLRVDNDRLSILDSGAEVAYINDRTMYITDGHFLNSLRIGRFAFIPRDNGNLSFVLMG